MREPSPLLLAGLRRIFLRRHAVMVSIGIHDFERAAAQRMLIDVDLWVDGGAVADDIAAVLDYDQVRTGIARIVAGRHFELQETLATEILDFCRNLPGARAVRVLTEKPDVYSDTAGVGLELFARRDG